MHSYFVHRMILLINIKSMKLNKVSSLFSQIRYKYLDKKTIKEKTNMSWFPVKWSKLKVIKDKVMNNINFKFLLLIRSTIENIDKR